MRLSDYVARFLLEREVDTVFGYQGSSISYMVDSICLSGIRYMQNYHEQAAAFSANAYAEISGKFGVSVACSGPGATNLITGIANSYFDSIPCLFITGQVSTAEMKENTNVRQKGFQETDIVSIVSPITKYACCVKDPSSIKYHLEKAFFLMLNGRQGAVLIDIPHDVQRSDIDADKLESFFDSAEYGKIRQKDFKPSDDEIGVVTELILKSRRPLILLGGGASSLRQDEMMEEFVNVSGIPLTRK